MKIPVDANALSSHPDQRPEGGDAAQLTHLRHAIEHAAHLLPAQGPITVFIHHNTLHALEDLPFTQAVKKAAKVFGCQPYLTEDRYRQELRRGRIRVADLEDVLRENLGTWSEEKILRFCTRLELRLAMLQYRLRLGRTAAVRWLLAETEALRRVRDDASAAVRERLTGDTHRWVMRDLRGKNEAGRDGNGLGRGPTVRLAALLERFGESRI